MKEKKGSERGFTMDTVSLEIDLESATIKETMSREERARTQIAVLAESYMVLNEEFDRERADAAARGMDAVEEHAGHAVHMIEFWLKVLGDELGFDGYTKLGVRVKLDWDVADMLMCLEDLDECREAKARG